MKAAASSWKRIATGIYAIFCAGLSLSAAGLPAPELFVFDNGVGRGSWTPEQQASTLEALGYNGISYNYTNPDDLAIWLKTFKQHGLKIYGLYVYTYVDRPQHYDPAFKQAIKMLKGTGTVIWLALCPPKVKGDYEAEAVKIVQDIADQTQENGVRVAIYGHFGFYAATTDDTVRLVKLAHRSNVGATLNLCHEFLSLNADHLEQSLSNSAPYLSLVSINGIDVRGKRYLLRLDKGDFDLAAWVRKLQAAGYKGPVGLQCYQVPGGVTENLTADIAAWRKIVNQLDRLSAPHGQ